MPDNIASTETLELAPRLSFRWRVIPATIQLGMGLPTAVVAVIIVCTAVYMNVKHGWIIADIRTPKLNRYTLTPRLLLECVLTFWIGASHATAGWAWLKGRWLLGGIATAIAFGAMVLSGQLGF